MAEEYPVFLIVPTNKYERSLTRYASSKCKCGKRKNDSCYNGSPIEVVESDVKLPSGDVPWPRDDPKWPTTCKHCGGPIVDGDYWVHHAHLYQRPGHEELFALQKAPVGACWDATWYHDIRVGPDGRSLIVKCPLGHDWWLESRASNCTLPKDHEHYCWVRHGKPEDGTLHVDKDGLTCKAGGGSIIYRGWHGHLHNGVLTKLDNGYPLEKHE